MTNETIYAFGSGDVIITFALNDGTDMIVPVKRFVSEVTPDGFVHGIFELGTELYDNCQKNIFEEIMTKEIEMDITVSMKPLDFKPMGSLWEPLARCERCTIDQKRLIVQPCEVVLSQYFFSNYSVDWNEIDLELPPVRESFNPDPLFRIARALEDIKKEMSSSKSKKKESKESKDDVVFTIEEFTELMLNGKLPDKYKNKIFEE